MEKKKKKGGIQRAISDQKSTGDGKGGGNRLSKRKHMELKGRGRIAGFTGVQSQTET